jgi:hypothetical protein
MRFPALVILSLLLSPACGGNDDDDAAASPDAGPPVSGFALASVVIDDAGRTTYVQFLPGLPSGHIDNSRAIEIGGNGVFSVYGRDIFIGLAEAPTWLRYTVAADGSLAKTGELSFANLGLSAIDYGNTIVDATTAVSVSSEQRQAIIWNPTTMEITGTVALPHLAAAGFETEVWTTINHAGLVYIPGRFADWDNGLIRPGVQLTILDPKTRTVLGVAEDDRCTSNGRPAFTADGTAYVMGDGRNYSAQMYANARQEAVPANCLLRIKPGATDFDPEWVRTVSALTGGLESATELDSPVQGSGVAFSKMFYPAKLPAGVEANTFDFWGHPVFKTWKLELGDEPTATEVTGVPFSTLGFDGSSVAGKLYSGESPDHATSVIYELDPATGTGVEKFTMDGLFYGIQAIE